jgi:hypothetical protein
MAVNISGGSYRNAARALPISSGLVAVLDASTGLPELLLFAYVRYCRGTGLRLTDRSARPSSAVVPE